MKTSIQSNYKNIRELIKGNVDTIIVLVQQAQGLEAIVNGINGTDTADIALKQNLEGQIASLRETIAKLVEQTDALFKSYDEMVESAFKA
jgi:hypothetical protein